MCYNHAWVRSVLATKFDMRSSKETSEKDFVLNSMNLREINQPLEKQSQVRMKARRMVQMTIITLYAEVLPN